MSNILSTSGGKLEKVLNKSAFDSSAREGKVRVRRVAKHIWKILAGPQGIEPQLTESESAVLPLDEGPNKKTTLKDQHFPLFWKSICYQEVSARRSSSPF